MTRAPNRVPVRQRGVALLTILLVVAIATVIGVSMASEQSFAIHRARNLLEQAQVNQYAMGGEELARQILYEDFESQVQRDFFAESWYLDQEVYEFEEGELQLTISDLQSKINLNAMLEGASSGIQIGRFARLLSFLSLDPSITDRLLDYMDSDQNRRPLGAEDYEYLGLETPYRTSGQALQSVTELMLLLDMDKESFNALLPYVTVLPERTGMLNVNTADPVVLQTLGNNISTDVIDSVLMAREGEDGIQSVEEFSTLMGTLPASQLNLQSLGVQSSFFQVDVVARIHDRVGYLSSIIYRDATDGSIEVIYREIGRRILPRAAAETEDESG